MSPPPITFGLPATAAHRLQALRTIAYTSISSHILPILHCQQKGSQNVDYCGDIPQSRLKFSFSDHLRLGRYITELAVGTATKNEHICSFVYLDLLPDVQHSLRHTCPTSFLYSQVFFCRIFATFLWIVTALDHSFILDDQLETRSAASWLPNA